MEKNSQVAMGEVSAQVHLPLNVDLSVLPWRANTMSGSPTIISTSQGCPQYFDYDLPWGGLRGAEGMSENFDRAEYTWFGSTSDLIDSDGSMCRQKLVLRL